MDSQEVLISPPVEAASENGQSQPAHQPDGDKASTEGLQGKPKAPPMKNSSTTITLSDWVTSTTKIKVLFDQIAIDHDRSIGHVRKLSEDRVQRRYRSQGRTTCGLQEIHVYPLGVVLFAVQ